MPNQDDERRAQAEVLQRPGVREALDRMFEGAPLFGPPDGEEPIVILSDGTIRGGGVPTILTRGLLDPGTY